jgi:hypothetical protein
MKQNSKVTEKQSKSLLQMSKNMKRFLSETKGIPCKIVNLNEGKTEKIDDEEKDVPGIYEIVGVQKKKGSKKFPWKITFDLDDIDDDGKPRRHMILDKVEVDFIVTTNGQLMLLLDNYQPMVEVKKEVKKEPVIA